jgi:hypothetical protein
MKDDAFYRYSAATWVLAALVLASLGFEDVIKHRVPRWWIVVSSFISLVVVTLSTLEARGLLHKLIGAVDQRIWAIASVGWAVAMIAAIGVAVLLLRGRLRSFVIGNVVILDAIAMFVVPQLSAPRAATCTRPRRSSWPSISERAAFLLSGQFRLTTVPISGSPRSAPMTYRNPSSMTRML